MIASERAETPRVVHFLINGARWIILQPEVFHGVLSEEVTESSV